MIKNWMNWEPSLIMLVRNLHVPDHIDKCLFSFRTNRCVFFFWITFWFWQGHIKTVHLHSLSAHLNIFPHAEDALSRTRRFLDTWKTGFAVKASQCSSHLYWSNPRIQTFWSNWSSSQCWLTTPEIHSACGRCSIMDQKVHQHLENRFRHEGKSML